MKERKFFLFFFKALIRREDEKKNREFFKKKKVFFDNYDVFIGPVLLVEVFFLEDGARLAVEALFSAFLDDSGMESGEFFGGLSTRVI